MSVAATLPCECPECKQISRSLRRKSVCIIMIENLQNVFLFKIPIFFLCMNLDYSSVIILKENTLGGGKSRVRSSETQLPTLAVHNISKMFPREQRKTV